MSRVLVILPLCESPPCRKTADTGLNSNFTVYSNNAHPKQAHTPAVLTSDRGMKQATAEEKPDLTNTSPTYSVYVCMSIE